ncbi:MAG: TlyA family RNA methyltransferase [Verrucomicrobiota bacterium]
MDSRSAAQRLIKGGKVTFADGTPVKKPSQMIIDASELIVTEPLRFVSRGGDKLAAWLERHPLRIEGQHCLDVGASTGGFTDCLLQGGATHVTCIDVGHRQLHPKISSNPSIDNLEGINAKDLDAIELPYPHYPIVVADLSFISLTKVLDPIWNRVSPSGILIMLVKPQFESSKAVVKRGKGIIRQESDRQAALNQVIGTAKQLPGARVIGSIDCPVVGGDGNHEYLLGASKEYSD